MTETIWVTLINAILGGTGIWSYIQSRRQKKFDMVAAMQGVYEKYVKHTDSEMGKMRVEIQMLRDTIEKNYENCNTPTCKNFAIKKSRNTD